MSGNKSATKSTNITFQDVVEAEGESREKAIKDLLSVMSLDEKLSQMSADTSVAELLETAVRYNARPYKAGGNKRLGIPPIAFTDGPRGIALNSSTCFPVSMARGATWDTALEERVGSVMGVEARAQGANFSGGVCINLLRHPGWGRAQESFGEDPFLLGEMGTAMIKGLQKHVMACAKHFAANSIENARFKVDVSMDERTLREVYLPHFRKCVKAGVASFMSAYNRLNGKFCGHNSRLLKDILKGDWNFDGFVISDFLLGVRGPGAAKAGLDIEMPFKIHFGTRLRRLVKKGVVPEAAIDEAAARIIRQKARFAKVGDPGGYSAKQVACKEHIELALEAARKSIVLLKNEGSTLPLEKRDIKKLAVIGELADFVNLGDRGSSRVYPPYVVTPLAGLSKKAGTDFEVIHESGRDLASARRAAGEADAVIVVAGLTYKNEGEYMFYVGGDRENLDLPKNQEEMIRAVAEENGKCIVVVEGGSAITMESWKDKVQAILVAWYPGMEGGNAIADVIFGDFNPCGKLPFTLPRSTEQLPFFDRNARSIEYGYYHGYRLFDKKGLEPAYPFGFGLSYTKYDYSNLRLDVNETGKDGLIEASVDVTNAGRIAGEEIVQLYVGYKGSALDRPVKELKGFGKLALEPGETKTLTIPVKAEDLAFYNADKAAWEIEEIEYEVYVGPSSAQRDLLSAGFRIKG